MASSENVARVCVVGSCNVDMFCYSPSLPKIGETIKGTQFVTGFGGKGANQAVQAAKLGASVHMIGKVGNDSYGRDTIKNFQDVSVNTDYLYVDDKQQQGAASGVALITVDNKGANTIVIIPGANDLLTVEEVHKARDVIANSNYLICQLEIPLEITLEAMRLAKQLNVKVFFNPAPAIKDLPDELFTLCDIICPNETELEILTGQSVGSVEEATAAAQTLLKKGVQSVLVTLGSRGSLLVSEGSVYHATIDRTVVPVDTTGAGDSFIGSGLSVEEAMKRANYVAGESVQKKGTQISFPFRKDLPASLFNN